MATGLQQRAAWISTMPIPHFHIRTLMIAVAIVAVDLVLVAWVLRIAEPSKCGTASALAIDLQLPLLFLAVGFVLNRMIRAD